MKKFCYSILLAAAALLLCLAASGCKKEPVDQPTTLAAPTNLAIAGEILTWDEVPGAVEYAVYLGEYYYKTPTNSYDIFELTEKAGETYTFQVVAVGDNEKYYHSQKSAGIDYSYAACDRSAFSFTPIVNGAAFEIKVADPTKIKGRVMIPAEHEGKRVTDIAAAGFADCTELTSIGIHNNIRVIGDQAFSGCSSLTRIKFSNTLKEIRPRAFENCSSLASLEIPKTVETCGYALTVGCEKLTSLTVEKDSKFYTDKENCIITKGGTLACAIESITAVPDGVKEIGELALSGYLMEEITLPKSLRDIGTGAFYKCPNLKSIVLPADVRSVGDHAFEECGNLSDVVLPDDLNSIGASAFKGCKKITEIGLPANLRSIGKKAFSGTYISFFAIPKDMTFIEAYGCVTDAPFAIVLLPSTVRELGTNAFSNQSIIFTDYKKESNKEEDAWPSGWIWGEVIRTIEGWIEVKGYWIDSEANYIYSGHGGNYLCGCEFGYDEGIPYVKSGLLTFTDNECVSAVINQEGGLPVPYRAGYTFAGWATEEGGDVVYAAQHYTKTVGDKTEEYDVCLTEDQLLVNDFEGSIKLYAVWTKNP